jgi:beta-1,4-N-acetylglucosaminyltransferase
MKKVLFISSTGGHLNELRQLQPLFEKYNSYLVTERTSSNLSLRKKYDKVSFLMYGTMSNPLVYPFKLFINCWISLVVFLKFMPDVVVTTGAHNAGPMCCIAKLLGKKVVYIETFANATTKSRTGKIVYLFADLFIVQWESMLKLYPKAKYVGGIF